MKLQERLDKIRGLREHLFFSVGPYSKLGKNGNDPDLDIKELEKEIKAEKGRLIHHCPECEEDTLSITEKRDDLAWSSEYTTKCLSCGFKRHAIIYAEELDN